MSVLIIINGAVAMKNIRISMVVLIFFCTSIGITNMVFASDEANAERIVKLLPADFKPAFTRDTVIKLNAIVSRSFDAINEYDAIIKGVRNAVAKATTAGMSVGAKPDAEEKVAQINRLYDQAKLALVDMMAAVKELKNSGEEYNKAILAGMIDFVEDVEREVSVQRVKLEKMLAAT